jgi:AcrR family transcriptional regulator
MYEHGVSAVSVEDVLTASGTGKSQVYHYFSGKEELVGEVLRHQLALVLEQQKRFELDSWDGIAAWLDGTVHWQRSQQFLGCPLGSIAGAVGEQGDSLRVIAADAFAAWESALADGLEAMRTRGLLRPDATCRRSPRRRSPSCRAATCSARSSATSDRCAMPSPLRGRGWTRWPPDRPWPGPAMY